MVFIQRKISNVFDANLHFTAGTGPMDDAGPDHSIQHFRKQG
jgi:hypothetical protein